MIQNRSYFIHRLIHHLDDMEVVKDDLSIRDIDDYRVEARKSHIHGNSLNQSWLRNAKAHKALNPAVEIQSIEFPRFG